MVWRHADQAVPGPCNPLEDTFQEHYSKSTWLTSSMKITRNERQMSQPRLYPNDLEKHYTVGQLIIKAELERAK